MSDIQAELPHQPGHRPDHGNAHDDQGDARRLQEDRPILGQVRAQDTGRRTKEDEDRAEAGDKEQGVPQHRQLLAERWLARMADSPAPQVGDIRGKQRQEADRDAGEQPGEEGQSQIAGHSLSSFAWISRSSLSSVVSPSVRATIMPRAPTSTFPGGLSTW